MLDLAEGIRRLGFRRWYERQLIESHVYFVTSFLSLVVVIAGLEAYNTTAQAGTRLLMAGLIGSGIVVCAWSFRRYQHLLGRAVRAAEHSRCTQCETYGALEVARWPTAGESASALTVRCRKCAHEWQIE